MTTTSDTFSWACIFDRLTNDSFFSLRTQLGDGVPHDRFRDIVFDLCVAEDPEAGVEPLRSELISVIDTLFLMIDINNNGDVSWDEFSHYVLHAVQASHEGSARDIAQRIVYPASHDLRLDCPRLKKTALRFIQRWDKYCFLEVQARQKSMLSLYKSQGDKIALHAQCVTNQVIEDVVFVESVNALCVTTVSEKLQFFSLNEDPVLAESGQLQNLVLTRDHYLEGRHPVLRYDPETSLLFAGGSNGTVSILDPVKDFTVLPPLLQKVRLHGTQPVVDVTVLPERGTKLMLTSGLDGKVQMYDIIRQEFFGELGSQIAPHSMSFSTEYSCLVTCSNKSLDPLVWSPHAVSNPFVHRMVDEKFSTRRSRLVECYCPPHSQYCFTADCDGLVKLWDMRKLGIVRTFTADAHEPQTEFAENAPKLWLRCFTAHPTKLDVVSCCRSETGIGLYYVKSDTVPERNPVVAHDDPVVSIDFARQVGWAVTASKDCVKFWDLETGSVVHHLKHFWTHGTNVAITACTSDSTGKRFYLGTEGGLVSMHSTLTCGMIGECASHSCSVHALLMRDAILYSAAIDGSFHVSNVGGDSPLFLFAGKLDTPVICTAFDACSKLCIAVVGDTEGSLTFYDCTEGANGAMIGISRTVRDPTLRRDITDVTELHPDVGDITCVHMAGAQPFTVFGDVRGYLGIVATRPHPSAPTRMCRWKCFFPRSSVTIFAVALSLDYDEDSETLIVGDDQGSITLWSCKEVTQRCCFQETRWPRPIAERIALPKPTDKPLSCSPRLLAHFSATGTSAPVRKVCCLSEVLFAIVENRVVLTDTLGEGLGSLMQGRGTALDGICLPYRFRREASVVNDVDPGTPVMIRRGTGSRSFRDLKGAAAVVAAAACGFQEMSDAEYNVLCTSAVEYVDEEKVFDMDAVSGIVTPPCTPRNVAAVSCRYSLPLENARGYNVNDDLPLFLQLKLHAQSNFAKVLPARALNQAEEHAHAFLKQVVDRLGVEVEGAPGIYLRPSLSRLKEATLAEIFSGAPSSDQDWQSDMRLHPSPNAFVTGSVLSFRPTALLASPLMPVTAALKDLRTAPVARSGSLVSDATSSLSSKPVRFVRFQRKAAVDNQKANVDVPPTLDDFVLPLAGREVPRSSVEFLRGKVSVLGSAAPTTPEPQPITPLKELLGSTSAEKLRPATSASRPKPLTFVVGYGQSKALARTPPPSWHNASTALERRARHGSANVQFRVGSAKSETMDQFPRGRSSDRQEYLQLLLHLPRVRKPTADETLDVVRRL